MNTPFQCCGAADPPCRNHAESCQNPENYPALPDCPACKGGGEGPPVTFFGGTELEYDEAAPCPMCNGTGAAPSGFSSEQT